MDITLKRKFGFELEFELDNLKYTEDIESRQYSKDENGKVIFSNPKRDVSTDAIETFVSVLQDMIHYREETFDSSGLIESLFEKLPQNVAIDLAKQLNKDYGVD